MHKKHKNKNSYYFNTKMWLGKFKIEHDCWISTKTRQIDVSVISMPLNAFTENDKKYHTGFLILKGTDKEKKELIKRIKKDKRVVSSQVNGSYVYAKIEGKDMITQFFDWSIFFIKPVLMEKGYEYWELGSWSRKKLMNFYDKVKKTAKIEILSIRNAFPPILLSYSIPKMTDKQRIAFDTAAKNGYYFYPRKISVTRLAKIMKKPRSTIQEHLRKAEAKIMNAVTEPFEA